MPSSFPVCIGCGKVNSNPGFSLCFKCLEKVGPKGILVMIFLFGAIMTLLYFLLEAK